ncbi:Gfo/Idh/MocA family protein [Brumicola pallidula]|uniref:Gfo/Idh/MocA-like oxidoreductase N-terminal domain-containing protein n=1 Tax=Brumicola pallidula DSM 14239 = ACAM 615 TaxID=1121922 RepID=K7A320_9ALTE|nr:Gfo/Idh/MocA family oxidoreductase [Glaciecola pallidula]GAC29870.1 hypothetical protein GPAL_3019 [Glaciecola pallidula DSM 14239 = ACAM 615]
MNRKQFNEGASLQYNKKSGLYKIYRFALIYGMRRALVKALGRLRVGKITRFVVSPLSFLRKKNKFISVVGCGQFTYSTSSFFLVQKLGNCIDACFDLNADVTNTYAKAYDAIECVKFDEVLERDSTKLVYIASNHASHTPYAIDCIKKGLDVYIEKPIAVTFEQLEGLRYTYSQSKSKIYVGYNRPFSKAIIELKSKMGDGPLTLTCSIIGHKLDADHWYREPTEGTRICGNLGHWIDLAIHLIWSKKETPPTALDIFIAYGDKNNFDDNLSVCFSSDTGDLIVLTMTAREEPFEGISESIVFQQNGVFAKIDDFKRAEFQVGPKKIIRKYFPKDVGHEEAILQPFRKKQRDLNEIFVSTELMLHITDMVRETKHQSVFKFKG